ncbi:MAG: FliM/FliN family flagellar motor C-terminal domain-containing protein [Pirellulales bacterium]
MSQPASSNTVPTSSDDLTLPAYSRSLLKILVPVTVTLATKRQSVREVIELVPGALISFDKPCDESLELAVNQRPLARGEAVKVGDKFGLRIAEMVLPEERFEAVQGQASGLSSHSA